MTAHRMPMRPRAGPGRWLVSVANPSWSRSPWTDGIAAQAELAGVVVGRDRRAGSGDPGRRRRHRRHDRAPPGRIVTTLVASSSDASMLVLGSRGHGRIGEALLGSVSQDAARQAQCPLVVVRRAHDADARRIVVGVDDSEPSLRALEFACGQAAATGDTVVLYRTWKPLTMPIDTHGDMPASTSRTLQEEEDALQKSVAEARHATRRSRSRASSSPSVPARRW